MRILNVDETVSAFYSKLLTVINRLKSNENLMQVLQFVLSIRWADYWPSRWKEIMIWSSKLCWNIRRRWDVYLAYLFAGPEGIWAISLHSSSADLLLWILSGFGGRNHLWVRTKLTFSRSCRQSTRLKRHLNLKGLHESDPMFYWLHCMALIVQNLTLLWPFRAHPKRGFFLTNQTKGVKESMRLCNLVPRVSHFTVWGR